MHDREPSRKILWFWWLVFLILVVVASLALAKLSDINLPKLNIGQTQPGLYSVTEFIDGDTIEVNMNGSTEIIRMIGVDTPETHRPNTPVQCYGPQASDYTKKLIGKNKVRLQADPLNTNRDRYDRLLRYVYLPDGTLVEDKLISQGYGFAYTNFPFLKSGNFIDSESAAKNARKGLWSACEVTTQPNGIRQTNNAN